MFLRGVALTLVFLTTAQANLGRLARIVGRDASLRGSYDFVIVGGGTSGLTVADRLTEADVIYPGRSLTGKVSVLVIEYGPLDKHEDQVLVPGLLDLDNTPYWYNLTSTPQEGLNNRTFQVPAAAVVGGGTVINGMFFDRGTAADYDVWEQLGNPGWGWGGLFPYFKKVREHGHPTRPEFLTGDKTGITWVPSSKDSADQTRSYARSAHYDRVISSRPNYHLLPLHSVSKLLVSDNKTVTGVGYVSRETGEIRIAIATKEVILAAGTVHTPQVLQLSGIGPKALLDSLDIQTVKDLPGVGYNLQDHPAIYTQWNFSNLPSPSADALDTNTTLFAESLSLYRTTRTGPLTIVDRGGNTAAFLPLSSTSPNHTSILALASSTNASTIYPSSTPSEILAGYSHQLSHILPHLSSPHIPAQEIAFGAARTAPVVLLKSLSRGIVGIVSRDASVPPRVDYRAVRASSDVAILAAAVRWTRSLMRTDAMAELGPTEAVPGKDVADDNLEAAIRANARPGYQHVVGTCAMMPEEWGGVVDAALKVYGVGKLRVVDASMMPVIPGTHTSSTVYAVAEKAADIIKKDHGLLVEALDDS
ncbi:hypothetical protein SLS57_005745 [Botryosphaeria dothidea]